MDVLLVEPNPGTRQAIRETLQHVNYTIHEVTDHRPLWPILRRGTFPLLVLAWPPQGEDGLRLLQRMRTAGRDHYTYVLLLTQHGDTASLAEAIQSGADDYLVKPLNLKELRRRVMLGARVVRLEQRTAQFRRAYAYLRTRDRVTGLMTRQVLRKYLTAAFERYLREGEPLSLIQIRFDQILAINLQYGDDVGDQALQMLAHYIAQSTRRPDLAGRWNGTTLLLALADTHIEAAQRVADRLRAGMASLRLPIGAEHSLCLVATVSVGSTDNGAPLDLDELMSQIEEV